jgi:REP element-mobilizing transposase RayT
MPNNRRAFTPCGTFLFYGNHQPPPAGVDPSGCVLSAQRRAVHDTRAALPFVVVTAVVLLDHLHAIRELPEGDAVFSLR